MQPHARVTLLEDCCGVFTIIPSGPLKFAVAGKDEAYIGPGQAFVLCALCICAQACVCLTFACLHQYIVLSKGLCLQRMPLGPSTATWA